MAGLFDRITYRELMVLFGRLSEDSDRWQGTADNAEYLTLVRYLAERESRKSP